MKWEKRGLVFQPAGQYDWVMSHAMLPVARHIEGDFYRIYFSGRDRFNRSQIGYIVININQPEKTVELSEKPVLGVGNLGAFDDNGVTPTWIIASGGTDYLYYFGWNKRSTVRASELSGLAVSDDNGRSFRRVSHAPIIDRTNEEPYTILVISCVLVEGGTWRMWYDSCDEWINADLPRYNIKYAESQDGIHWQRQGVVSVDFKYPNETRVSRACVIKEDFYKMWFCFAIGAEGYRMGYAESADGIRYTRKDDVVGIDVSASGWDSEMVCYPFVFSHRGRKYMLYCGNGYGRTGFGYAVESR